MIVHQCHKNIVSLSNVNKRVEPFTYPLFYPAGTDGFSPDLKLQTSYALPIKQALQINLEDVTISQQLPQDRPDIVARTAKLKFDQLIEV